MKKPPSLESRQLRTLERWRTVELENAQTEYVTLQKVTLEKQSAHERISADIAAVQAMARDAVGGTSLSVEVLQRLHAFAVHQANELSAAQAEIEQSQVRSNEAHDNLVQHFERLSVVERLKARRAQEGMKQLARADEKQLDEHAMTRARIDAGSTAAAAEIPKE